MHKNKEQDRVKKCYEFQRLVKVLMFIKSFKIMSRNIKNVQLNKKMALKYIKTNVKGNKLSYHSIYCYEEIENKLS